MEAVWLSFAVFKKLARTSHKELDFSREESVHADVVGGLEGMVPAAKSASLQ